MGRTTAWLACLVDQAVEAYLVVEEGLLAVEEGLADEASLVEPEYLGELECLVGLGYLLEVVEVLQDDPDRVVQAEVVGLLATPSAEVEELLAGLEDLVVEVGLLSVVELGSNPGVEEALQVIPSVAEVFQVIPSAEVVVPLLLEVQEVIQVVGEAHQAIP